MAVAEAPFDLADVKLAAPLPRPATVAKTAAIARLCAARSPVATVVAPAGYGKTTLLARWAQADPRPFAWVALDGRDDDAVVFLRYIAAAIHGVEPLAPEVFESLSGPGGTAWPQRVARLGRALAALEHPMVLVLDDLHAVANPTCLDVLTALVGYVPSGSQIAIASREAPGLPLGRWRAQGLLDEIEVADLRLDEREDLAAAVGNAGPAGDGPRALGLLPAPRCPTNSTRVDEDARDGPARGRGIAARIGHDRFHPTVQSAVSDSTQSPEPVAST